MKLLLSVLFGFSVFYSSAQQATINGTITDKRSGFPVESATATIFRLKDSSLVATAISNRKGKFSLIDIDFGEYILSVSFVGYAEQSTSFAVDNRIKNLGTIQLQAVATDLKEVVVTGTRAVQMNSIDRKVYNVSRDLVAQTGSAAEVLRNIPSVEVNIEGQVTLRGSGDMLILINGRPSHLMTRSSAEVLQQLPASFIERIEVITNPSAKFKPDGSSGIINIVLKKNAGLGWNTAINASAGSNKRYNKGININYKPGKLNLYSGYNYRHDRRYRENEITREFSDSFYNESGKSQGRPNVHIANMGIEFTASRFNSFGISGNYFTRAVSRSDISQRHSTNSQQIATERFNRFRDTYEKEIEKELAGYWQHNFSGEDHELRTEFSLSWGQDNENNHTTNVFTIPSNSQSLETVNLAESDNQQEFSADYSRPLDEESGLEAGYEGSFNQIDLDFRNSDITKSNRFKYDEGIHAFYTTYERTIENFGFKAGLRAEQVILNGNLVTKDSIFRNNYFNIYPTLHLSLQMDKNELQLNYSKRVNRPDGDELNPFPEYQDPYNLHAGNPKLLPEIIHSFEFGYKFNWKKLSFIPSLYYRYRKNGFTSITRAINDSVLLTTEENLSKDHSAGLELIFSANPGKNITANLNSNIFYNQIDATELGYSANKSIISMSASFNCGILLAKHTMGQVNSNFRSARLTPQGRSYASFVLNAGVKQDLLKNKLAISLTVSDLFKTQRQKSTLETSELKQSSLTRRDGRIIFLGMTWRIGGLLKKQSESKLEFDDSL